ncbi:hypothetical protein AAG570_009693 [Ranatra chinensis]|uniref:Uncharacterized protein n=1 Tax=Ranatra chinensis TaxID=642074 RepID=A0ABD0Z6Y7_9HEMI
MLRLIAIFYGAGMVVANFTRFVASEHKTADNGFSYDNLPYNNNTELYCDYPHSLKAEDGVQAPKHVLLEQEAEDINRIYKEAVRQRKALSRTSSNIILNSIHQHRRGHPHYAPRLQPPPQPPPTHAEGADLSPTALSSDPASRNSSAGSSYLPLIKPAEINSNGVYRLFMYNGVVVASDMIQKFKALYPYL